MTSNVRYNIGEKSQKVTLTLLLYLMSGLTTPRAYILQPDGDYHENHKEILDKRSWGREKKKNWKFLCIRSLNSNFIVPDWLLDCEWCRPPYCDCEAEKERYQQRYDQRGCEGPEDDYLRVQIAEDGKSGLITADRNQDGSHRNNIACSYTFESQCTEGLMFRFTSIRKGILIFT